MTDQTCDKIAKMVVHSLLNRVISDEDLEKEWQIAPDCSVASACIGALPPQTVRSA